MITRDNITTDVQNIVKSQFEKNGFVLDIENEYGKYVKKYEWGYDYSFLPHVRFLPEHINFNLTVYKRINLIEEIWQEWSNLLNVSIEDPNDITTLYITEKNAYSDIINEKYYDGYGSFIFEISNQGLSKVETIIDNIFNQKIIVKSNELTDLKNIDKLINSDLDAPQNIGEVFNVDSGFMFRRLAVAKFTKNEIYEKICKLYKSRFEKIEELAKTPGKEYFVNYPIVFEKVYERLKNVEPLSNMIYHTNTQP